MCKTRLLQVWAAIWTLQRGNGNALRLASLLEAAATAEVRAQNAFIYVLYRCQEAEPVYRKYAQFLREIQDNESLAFEIQEHADNLKAQTHAAAGESKSQGSTSKNSANQADQRKLLRTTDKASHANIWLTLKLRSATLLLMGVVIGLFIRIPPPRTAPHRTAPHHPSTAPHRSRSLTHTSLLHVPYSMSIH